MIQTLAYIDPQAKIAQNVVVEPFSVIHKNVEIGEGTWIGSNVTIFPGARIGKNCRIFPGAVISAFPQDLKFDGEETIVEIGNNTTLRECVTVNRGTRDKHITKVGHNCLLMAYVHLAHDVIIGNNVIIANGVQVGGHVEIADNARIGGLCAVHQFVNIGRHVMIEGGSMVSKDVPPFVKAGRYPLSYEGVNSIGLRRSGFSAEKINEIQDIYRVLFVHNTNMSKAFKIVEASMQPSGERDEILGFLRDSERGVMKGFQISQELTIALMEVRLEQVGKRFNRQWLYTDLSALIPAGSSCAVIGPNGSGKSTLLQLIYQYMLPTKGKASVYMDGLLLEHEMLIRHTAFVAPYLELPEELTLSELMRFHFKIRGHALPDMEKIIHACGLSGNEDKQVRYFSSGMKQRLKLALAFFTGCKLLLLDEPCSNLDSAGIAWYQKMIGDAKGKCTIVVASNQSEEYAFCDKVIHIRNEIS